MVCRALSELLTKLVASNALQPNLKMIRRNPTFPGVIFPSFSAAAIMLLPILFREALNGAK